MKITDISLLIEQSLSMVNSSYEEIRFNNEERKFLCEHFIPVEIKKNEFLIKAGDNEKFLYFLEEGIVRYWTTFFDADVEKEVFIWFAFPGDFVGFCFSCQFQIFSTVNIQALKECKMWRINKKDFAHLCEYSLNMNKIIRIILENLLINKTNHEIDLLGLSGRERYQNILKREKEVIEFIQLKYIASYIRLTPQTLSHIRKDK